MATLFRSVLLILFVVLAAPAFAQGAPNIRAELVAESRTPRPGEAVTLAFVMTPQPGWHGYWKNPGDAGIETSATWTLPEGVTAGPLLYQVPQRLLLAGLMQYVYEGPYAHPVTLVLSPDIAPGTRLPVGVRLDWLECTDEVCVPATATLSTELVAGDGAVAPAERGRFDGIRARLPRPLGADGAFEVAGERVRIGVPLPQDVAVAEAYFYPLTDGLIDYAAPQTVTRDGDRLVIETGARGAAALRAAEGVLALDGGRGFSLTLNRGAVAAGGEPLGQEAGFDGRLFLIALGGAIVGGLILNVMPCVFPILSLKALSLAKAGGEGARAEGLAYTAGVVGVCLLLGAVLLVLRASGEAAGWAFQLQDPRVVGLLLLVTAAIGLNLAGLFELPAVAAGGRFAGRGGLGGAFWTGALAAFVATPCTGPFMGAALSAALVLPAVAALAVFAGLGLGLALPFLLIAMVPALRTRLPRPGPWMAKLRHGLAIPMFLTALGLAWILGRQAGVDAMTVALLAALVAAMGLWWAGRRQAGGRPVAAGLTPALVAAVALLFVMPDRGAATPGGTTAGALGAVAFDETRLAALRAEGRPVFVYFTADWCITCKVNERTAIDRDEVANAFARGNVAVMVGDWTRGDPEISRFLARHGRSGVPLYLWYAPNTGEPRVLPQVLTAGLVAGLVRQ